MPRRTPPLLDVREVTDDRSLMLPAIFAIYEREFPRGERETRVAIRRWLHDKAGGRLFPDDYHVLAAVHARDAIAGFALFHYLADINCGFLGYMAVERSLRNRGIGSLLFGRVRRRLEADAEQRGVDRPAGVFMELDVHDGSRAASARLRFWERLDALPLGLEWHYPRLRARGEPATMYLAFSPFGRSTHRVDSGRIRRAVRSIYNHVYRGRKNDAGLRSVLASIEGVAYVRRVRRSAGSAATRSRARQPS